MNKVRLFITVLLSVLPCSRTLAGIPPKPSVPMAVYDYADILTPEQYSGLNRDLIAFSDTTSNRIVVLIIADLEGMTSSEYAYEVGESWGVGGRHDNGVVLLVKPRTAESGGDVAISVGYGLEGVLPDAVCSRIIRNDMIPYFSKGQYFEGICAGVLTLKGRASGEYSEGVDDEDGVDEVFVALMVIIIIFVIIYHLSRRKGGGGGSGGGNTWIYPGGGLGDGGHSGGGFSGGFSGGFGGGHFGGGGASGKFMVGLAEMPSGLFLRGASPGPRIGGGGASGKFMVSLAEMPSGLFFTGSFPEPPDRRWRRVREILKSYYICCNKTLTHYETIIDCICSFSGCIGICFMQRCQG